MPVPWVVWVVYSKWYIYIASYCILLYIISSHHGKTCRNIPLWDPKSWVICNICMSPCELNKCCSWKRRRKVVPKSPRYPTNTPCFARVYEGNSVNCNFSKTKKQPKCPEGLRGTNSVEIPTVEAEFQQLNHLLMMEKSHQLNYIVQNATIISKAYRILVHSSFNFLLFFPCEPQGFH